MTDFDMDDLLAGLDNVAPPSPAPFIPPPTTDLSMLDELDSLIAEPSLPVPPPFQPPTSASQGSASRAHFMQQFGAPNTDLAPQVAPVIDMDAMLSGLTAAEPPITAPAPVPTPTPIPTPAPVPVQPPAPAASAPYSNGGTMDDMEALLDGLIEEEPPLGAHHHPPPPTQQPSATSAAAPAPAVPAFNDAAAAGSTASVASLQRTLSQDAGVRHMIAPAEPAPVLPAPAPGRRPNMSRAATLTAQMLAAQRGAIEPTAEDCFKAPLRPSLTQGRLDAPAQRELALYDDVGGSDDDFFSGLPPAADIQPVTSDKGKGEAESSTGGALATLKAASMFLGKAHTLKSHGSLTVASHQPQSSTTDDELPEPVRQELALPTLDTKGAFILNLNVSTMHGTDHMIQCNPSWTIRDVLHSFARSIKLWQVEFFTLALKKNDVYVWLPLDATLTDAGVKDSYHLYLKVMYFKTPRKLRDNEALRAFYAECQRKVVDCMFKGPEARAFQLASLQLQISNGAYNMVTYPLGWLANEPQRMHTYLPAHVVKKYPPDYVERRLYQSWGMLGNLSATDAMRTYMDVCTRYGEYGADIYNVSVLPSAEPRFLGVVEDGILLSRKLKVKLAFFAAADEEEDLEPNIIRIEWARSVMSKENDVLQLGAPASLVKIVCAQLCGYYMLLAGRTGAPAIPLPLKPVHPRPELYEIPPSRQESHRRQSRLERMRRLWLQRCATDQVLPYEPLLFAMDLCLDTEAGFVDLDLSRCGWTQVDVERFTACLVEAKEYVPPADVKFEEDFMCDTVRLQGIRLPKKDRKLRNNALAAVGALLSQFTYPCPVRKLDMSGMGFSMRDIVLLGRYLEKLDRLSDVNFSNNPLEDGGLRRLLEFLKAANPNFEALRLSNCSLEKKSCMLLRGMFHHNGKFRHLDVSHNRINDLSAKYLTEAFTLGGGMTYCDLSYNTFGENRMLKILTWLSTDKKVEVFKMGGLLLKGKVVQPLAEILARGDHRLMAIDVGKNDFGAKGARKLIGAFGRASGVAEFCVGKLKIDSEAAQKLAEFLPQKRNLSVVSLQGVPLGPRDWGNVLQALGQCVKLRDLNLGGTQLRGKGCSEGMEALLRTCVSLRHLDCTEASMCLMTWPRFCEALGSNHTLTRLTLSKMSIHKQGWVEFKDALDGHMGLLRLDLCSMGLDHATFVDFLGIYMGKRPNTLHTIDVGGNTEVRKWRKDKKWAPRYQMILDRIPLKIIATEEKS